MASSSAASAAAGTTTRWQDALTAACKERALRPPVFQMYSDRRGGRTAWTCAVTVGSETIQARFWYDGSFVNNAKEDAAEVALQRLQTQPGGGAMSPQLTQQQPQATSGQQQQQQQPGGGQKPQSGQQGWYQ